MVEYVTKSRLKELTAQLNFSEQVRVRKAAEGRQIEGSTFLSHSSKDNELVVGAINVLEENGGRVYVDAKDPEMPPFTSDETANLLKKRIKQTRRFVMLTTKNSIESRWVPWELGYADGQKNLDEIALFLALDYSFDDGWTSSEYLGLYRRIVWGKFKNTDKNLWLVWNHKDNSATSLKEWLQGQ